MVAETEMQVGAPKFLRPSSVYNSVVIFFSFDHRTTSHGAVSSSNALISLSFPAVDELRECVPKNEGDRARGDGESDGLNGWMRDWKRRSNGLSEGEGEKRDTATVLPANEDVTEPCTDP